MLWLEIPAYAGSTDRPLGRPRPGADHPRIRGEHPGGGWHWYWALGSSPHTRGAPGQQSHQDRRRWIIPAYAGSTPGYQAILVCLSDHPRIRGEHPSARSNSANTPGSSPHTRGAPRYDTLTACHSGIIPAYAGSTHTPQRSRRPGRDHPRIRGEHDYIKRAPEGLDGSSPHTRGARGSRFRGGRAAGIIPAYAGSTSARPPTKSK